MWRDARSSRKGHQSSQSGKSAGSATQQQVSGIEGVAHSGHSIGDGSGAVGMARIDAIAAAAESSGVAVDAASAGRSTPAFVVDNPLRRPVRHSDGSDAATHVSAAGATVDSHVADERLACRGVALSPQLSATTTVMVASTVAARLQRVMTAQRPVQSKRTGESPRQDGV
jgi:hypothetical protein